MAQLTFDSLEINSLAGEPLIRTDHLSLGQGMYALTGPNGAGKSTFLRAIMGLHAISAGTIRLGEIDNRRHRRQFLMQAAFQPQNFAAYPDLTGLAFLAYFLKLRGYKGVQADKSAQYWLTKVGLEEQSQKRTSTYSQGMLQRLGLAYVLQNRAASVCLLDEPFAGVDPVSRASGMDLLAQHAQERTVILCTHHVEEAVEAGACQLLLSQRDIVLT